MPKNFAAHKRGRAEGKLWPSDGAKCFHPSREYVIRIIHDAGNTIEGVDRNDPHPGYRLVEAVRESDGVTLYSFEPVSSGRIIHGRGEVHHVRTRLANAGGTLVYHVFKGVLYTQSWYTEANKA